MRGPLRTWWTAPAGEAPGLETPHNLDIVLYFRQRRNGVLTRQVIDGNKGATETQPGDTDMATFYHAHVAGFTKHADSVAEVQTWIDSLRGRVVGETLKVWRVVDYVADATPCIHGPVTA